MASSDTPEMSLAEGRAAMEATVERFLAWLESPADVPYFPSKVEVSNGVWCCDIALALSASTTPPALPPFPQPSETFWMLLWRLVVCAARVSAYETTYAGPSRVGTSLSAITKWVYGDNDVAHGAALQACCAFLGRAGIIVQKTTPAEVWEASLDGKTPYADGPVYRIDASASELRSYEPWLEASVFAGEIDVCVYALLAVGVAASRRRWHRTKHSGFSKYAAHLKLTWSRGRSSTSGHGLDVTTNATVAELDAAIQRVGCLKSLQSRLVEVRGSETHQAREAKKQKAGSVGKYYNLRLSFEIHLGPAWLATPAGREIALRYHQKPPNATPKNPHGRFKVEKTQRCATSCTCPFKSADRQTECAISLDIEETPSTPAGALAAFIVARRQENSGPQTPSQNFT